MTPTEKPGCLPTILQRLGLGQKQEPEQSLPYRLRDDFLSPAEASFYQVLHSIVTDRLLICPKVGLGDIFFVARPNENAAYRNKIDRKHVDFLLCDPKTLKPLMGIELDDSSHQRARRVTRDEFVDEVFAIAHLPLLRIPASHSYDTRAVAAQLKAALQSRPQPAAAPPTETTVPLCPKCGVPMVLRTAQRGSRQGEQFYGCPNYPQCRELIPVT
jgi:predicted RNA-binding Zn-ribbon protein involved in translation (DUF1610 family)